MFKQSFKLYYRLSPYHEIQRIYLQLEILIGQNIMKLEPSVISVVTSNIIVAILHIQYMCMLHTGLFQFDVNP